jgi:hypothetical protein
MDTIDKLLCIVPGKPTFLMKLFYTKLSFYMWYRSTGPGFASRRYQVFFEVVGVEWGTLSLMRITEELFE